MYLFNWMFIHLLKYKSKFFLKLFTQFFIHSTFTSFFFITSHFNAQYFDILISYLYFVILSINSESFGYYIFNTKNIII